MYRLSRANRILKGTGSVLCGAILVIWCITASRDVYFRMPGLGLLFAGEGYFALFATNTEEFSLWEEPAAWTTESAQEFGIEVYDQWLSEPEDAWQASPLLESLARRSLIVYLEGGGVAIPMSFAFAIMLLPTVALFYRDRRRRLVNHRFTGRRKRLIWTGAVVAVLIFGVWLMSLWYAMGIQLPWNIYVKTFNAVIEVGWIENEKQPNASWTTQLHGPQFAELGIIWPHYKKFANNSGEWGYVAYIPFWLLLFITAILTTWPWHRDRRIRPGCCVRCGYDLTGNISGVCSECGEKPAITIRRAQGADVSRRSS